MDDIVLIRSFSAAAADCILFSVEKWSSDYVDGLSCCCLLMRCSVGDDALAATYLCSVEAIVILHSRGGGTLVGVVVGSGQHEPNARQNIFLIYERLLKNLASVGV